MAGTVRFEQRGAVARVTISHPQRFNAMSRDMWRQLRLAFAGAQQSTDLRCIVIAGENGNFCAGGDISEYPDFRFQESSLRQFHEIEVWGGLQAMLDCDIPIVAQIEGHCMGAGMEIASCCDLRLAAASATFGAPIARLGFPMAPREAALVAREAGLNVVRQMLLEARLFSAGDMVAAGFLRAALAEQQLAAEVQATVARVVALAPQAARLNKRTVRALCKPSESGAAPTPDESSRTGAAGPYGYAASAEHREGILAFLDKRKPEF